MMRKIEVVPYNPEWPRMYAAEAERLRAALGFWLVEIHHIGSTAIPGIFAKPVIDILPVVKDLSDADEIDRRITQLGYIAMGEADIPGRRFFLKPSLAVRTHHVHVFASGSPEIDRHLFFRDYLRAHPAEAEAYSRLKQELAELYPYDPYGYTNAKDSFIQEFQQKAFLWQSRLPKSGLE